MALSIFITLLVIPPILLFLILFFSTSGYMATPPGGPDAMALFLPMALSVIAGLALLVATWLAAARGGFDFISARAYVPAIVSTLVTLGVSLGATIIFVAWADRNQAWVAKLGWLAGGVAPVGLCALLLVAGWIPTQSARQSTALKFIFAPLALWSLVGLVTTAAAGVVLLQQRSIKIQNRIAQAQAEEAEWERKRNRSPIEAVREDYSEMHPDSPLWTIAAGLPDYTDAECRAFIIERAFKVPNFESQLASCLATSHPRYRHGCLDIVRFAPGDRRRPEWAAYIVNSIEMSADQIESDPKWMVPDEMANPNPIEHIRAMSQAARVMGMTPELKAAIEKLRVAIVTIPDEAVRVAAVRAIDSN